MFAVIFEVTPKPAQWDRYLALAKRLKPEIEQIDGFLDNERFASRHDKGRLLSLSTWRDEKALIRWRTLEIHHQVQEAGRFEVFQDYHLRVGEITADSAPPGLVLRQQRLDETEIGVAKAVTICELAPIDSAPAPDDLAAMLGLPKPGTQGLIDQEPYESLYNPGKKLLLAGWRDTAAAEAWTLQMPPGRSLRHRLVRVVRDYGMFDRREAPQYYPAVA